MMSQTTEGPSSAQHFKPVTEAAHLIILYVKIYMNPVAKSKTALAVFYQNIVEVRIRSIRTRNLNMNAQMGRETNHLINLR